MHTLFERFRSVFLVSVLLFSLLGGAVAPGDVAAADPGTISFDSSTYVDGDTVTVTVEDADLSTSESYVVNIESETETQNSVLGERPGTTKTYTTIRSVADENNDNKITEADIEYRNNGGGANSIASISRNQNGTVTITFAATTSSLDALYYTRGETIDLVHESGEKFSGKTKVSTVDSVGTLQIVDGDSLETRYFDQDPSKKYTASAIIDEDPDPLTLGPVTEFSVADLAGTTLSHTESVVEVPFSEDVSKAGGASGALTLADNVTVTVDGEDVTSRYTLDADGSSGGQVVLTSATPLGPRSDASVRIDAVNDSIDSETIAPGAVDVVVADATVAEGDEADHFENETLAFVANDGTGDVDQAFEVTDAAGALVFAGRTGAGSQAFVFDTAARNWSGDYAVETRLDDGSTDRRTEVAVRALDLGVAVDDRTVTTADAVSGAVLANAAGRAVEVALAEENGSVVARANETTAGNGETPFEFGAGALSAAGPGNYTVTATDAATGRTETSERITVVDAAEQTAAFRAPVVGEHAGDVAEIPVDLTYADAATVTIGGAASGFRANVTVADRDGDGAVRVRFNTEAVAERTRLPADGDDVFGIAPSRIANESEGGGGSDSADDAVVAADVDDRYAVTGSLAAGEYALGVRPGTDPDAESTAVGTLVLDAPAPASIETWVAPAGTDLSADGDVAAALDAGRLTPAAEIAAGDVVVHRIAAPGLAGAFASQSGTDAEAFFALNGTDPGDRYALNVTRANPPANGEAYQLALNDSSADVVADPANDTYAVAYRIDGPGASDGDAVGTRGAGGAPEPGDALTAAFTLNESGVFDGLDDAERSASDDYALVEGRIATDRDPVVVAAAPNQSIGGRTTAAPGTVVELRVRPATGSDGDARQTATAVVGADRTWRAVFDFGNRSVGENFTLTSAVGVVADADELAVGGEIRANATVAAAPNLTAAPNATGAGGALGAVGAVGGGGSGGSSGSAGGDDAGRTAATATGTARSTASATGAGESVADSIREFGEEVVARVTADRGEGLRGRLTGFDALVAFSGLLLVGGFFVSRRG